jgi:hypothetical protein
MKTRKTEKGSNVEYWVHWSHPEKRWFEVPKEERKKYLHVCEMVYSSERQFFMWGGDWQGIHPICWCGHAFEEYEIYTPEEYRELLRKVLGE